MFITRIDALEKYDGKELVVTLGSCQLPDNVDEARILSFPNADGKVLQILGSLDMRLYQAGISLVVASTLVERNHAMVRLIQKHLLFCYIKYIWFPKQNTVTPDPLGVGGNKGALAGLVYDLYKLENLPHLMGAPRTKDLEGGKLSYPLLLLAPGPSLNEIGPHIKELSKRFIVVCLSRTLNFCQKHGITPDIVLQLDTHGEQSNYYPKDMDFSQSLLFLLSIVPASKYINRFERVVWIDTFNPEAFGGEDYQMRNSWLSSFIPLLGVAELFHSPKVLIAGADLSYRSTRYCDDVCSNECSIETLSPLEEVAAVHSLGEFSINLGNGEMGKTNAQYLATAFEAESIASELSASTQFFNMSRTGILEEVFFPYKDPSEFEDEAELDKGIFLEQLKQAIRTGNRADEKVVQRSLVNQLHSINLIWQKANMVVVQGEINDEIAAAAKIISNLHFMSRENCFQMGLEVIRRYKQLVENRLQLFRLSAWTHMGKMVPVYCYLDERASLETALSRRFPEAKWEFRNTWSEGGEPLENRIEPHMLVRSLEQIPIALMTRRYAAAGDYVLSYLKSGLYPVVEDILEAPWPGEIE